MDRRPLGVRRGERVAFEPSEAHRTGGGMFPPRQPGPATTTFTGREASPAHVRRRALDALRPVQGLACAVALSAPLWAVLAAPLCR